MIPLELREQLDRWLDDDLSSDECTAVSAVLEQNGEAIEYLAERALLHALLAEAAAASAVPASWGLADHPAGPSALGPNELGPNEPGPNDPGDSPGPTASPGETGPPDGRDGQGRGRRSARPAWRVAWLAWWGTLAGLMLVALSWLVFIPSGAEANPTRIVEQTLETYRLPRDRRYEVSVEFEPGVRRRGFPPGNGTGSTLWVRGSQFVQTFATAGGALIWGRDGGGAVWFIPGGETSALFEPAEMP